MTAETNGLQNALDLVRTGAADKAQLAKLYKILLTAPSALEKGQCFSEIRTILGPSGTFQKFINVQKVCSLRSAYRYMNGFEYAMYKLPWVIVKEAMAMDLSMVGDSSEPIGRYTAVVEQLPPPLNPTPKAARVWLERIEAATPRSRPDNSPRTTDPERVMQEIYRVVDLRSRWPDFTPREEKDFATKLIGLIMARFNLAEGTFSPVEVPENYHLRDQGAIRNASQGQVARRARAKA